MSLSLQQLRGLKDLLQDAVSGGIDAAEKLQARITRQPYALLQRIEPIALTVRRIEAVQTGITSVVYGAVRLITRGSGALGDRLLDLAARKR